MASYNTTYTNRKSTQVNGAIKSNNVTVAAMYSEDVSIKDIDTTLPLENDNTFKGLFTYLEKLERRVHDLENQGGTTPVEPDPVKVTGISVSPTTLNLTEAGATGRLTVTITPDNATDKNVTWSTNNDAVATVSNDGTVTTVGNGDAVITVKSVDGDYTATCTVTVNVQEEPVQEGYYWYLGITDPNEYANSLFDESTIDNTIRAEYNSDINIGWRGWHKVEREFDRYNASHPLWSSRIGDTYLPNDVIWYIALPCKTNDSFDLTFNIYNELGSVATGREWSLMSETPIKVGSGYCFVYEKTAPSQRLAHYIY